MRYPRFLMVLATTAFVGCAGLHDCCHSQRQWRCSKAAYRQSNVDPTRCGYPKDFKDGWINGYYDVAMGSNGCLPAVPPKKYWKCKCGDAKHGAAAMAWFAGYSQGAAASMCCCGGCCNTIPTSPTAVLPDRYACRDSSFYGPAVQDQRVYRGPDFHAPPAGGEEIGRPAEPTEPMQLPPAGPEAPVTPTPEAPAEKASGPKVEQSSTPTASLPRLLSSIFHGKRPAAAEPKPAVVAAVAPPVRAAEAAPLAVTPAPVANVQAAPTAVPTAPLVSTPALDYVAPVYEPTPVVDAAPPVEQTVEAAPVAETVEALPPVVDEIAYEPTPVAAAPQPPPPIEEPVIVPSPTMAPATPEPMGSIVEQLQALPPVAAELGAVANRTETPVATAIAETPPKAEPKPQIVEQAPPAAAPAVAEAPAVVKEQSRAAKAAVRPSPAVQSEAKTASDVRERVADAPPVSEKPAAAPAKVTEQRSVAPRPIAATNLLRSANSPIKISTPGARAGNLAAGPVRIVAATPAPPTKPASATATSSPVPSRIVINDARPASKSVVRPDAAIRVVASQPSVAEAARSVGVVIPVTAEPIPVRTATKPQTGAEIRIR